MKKEYNKPLIEIVYLVEEDIITTSVVFGGPKKGDVNLPFADL